MCRMFWSLIPQLHHFLMAGLHPDKQASGLIEPSYLKCTLHLHINKNDYERSDIVSFPPHSLFPWNFESSNTSEWFKTCGWEAFQLMAQGLRWRKYAKHLRSIKLLQYIFQWGSYLFLFFQSNFDLTDDAVACIQRHTHLDSTISFTTIHPI